MNEKKVVRGAADWRKPAGRRRPATRRGPMAVPAARVMPELVVTVAADGVAAPW